VFITGRFVGHELMFNRIVHQRQRQVHPTGTVLAKQRHIASKQIQNICWVLATERMLSTH